MAAIVIIKNDVPIRCDLFRCANVADYRISIDGESYATHIVLCEECLKGIYQEAGKIFEKQDVVSDEVSPLLNIENTEQEEKTLLVNDDTTKNKVPPEKKPKPVGTGQKGKGNKGGKRNKS